MPNSNTKDEQVSLRLPGELKARIETYAQLTGRSKSHVAMEALTSYLDWRMPQVADLERAVGAADRGEWASDDDVRSVLALYGAAPKKTARRRA